MTKVKDEETGHTYICCYDEEFKQWSDDCGGRYCTLIKQSWSERNYEDLCDSCPYVCEGDGE